jgi:hypothetical protein
VHRKSKAAYVKVRLKRKIDRARAADITTLVDGSVVRITLPLVAPETTANAEFVGSAQ